jgi:hypothetical protein
MPKQFRRRYVGYHQIAGLVLAVHVAQRVEMVTPFQWDLRSDRANTQVRWGLVKAPVAEIVIAA